MCNPVVPLNLAALVPKQNKVSSFKTLQNRRMKAKKDGKQMKNMMDGMPDSGGIVPGIGHPDSSGRCLIFAFSKCIQ